MTRIAMITKMSEGLGRTCAIIFLTLLFSGSLTAGGTEGGKGGLIRTDVTGAIIGQFGDGPITIVSDDSETMTVKDKYGCEFTYNFGQERWYDQHGLAADADACGFTDERITVK